MARKKKQPPSANVVNISLSEIDLVAKGTELANRWAQIDALRKQKSESNAHFNSLIDEQLDLAAAVAAQIRGGSEARNQASLKANEAGELVVPDQPFEDTAAAAAERAAALLPLPELTPEDSARVDAEKVAEGLKVPPAVADAIAKNGGEVDLSAGKAKNAKAKKPEAKSGKKQPPSAPNSAVTVASKPSSCPECGSKVTEIDASGVYACADEHDLSCGWVAVVEAQDVTTALGAQA